MKNKLFCLIYICAAALFMTGCASKNASEGQESLAPKNEARALTVIDETLENEGTAVATKIDVLEDQGEEEEEVEEAPSVPAHTFMTEVQTPDGTNFIINVEDIAQRITFTKQTADNYDLNYQVFFPLGLAFWGRELPKSGDTVTIIFSGMSSKDIPYPVFAGLVGNGFGTQVEFWDNLVSFDNDDENYVLFAQNIKAGELFTASASFRLYEDCQNNIALHLVYPAQTDSESCIWVVAR